MNVVFVHKGFEGLGISYLSSYLRARGHATDLVFDPVLFKAHFLHMPALARLMDYSDIVLAQLRRKNPDIAAFSVMSDDYQWASILAKRIKEQLDIPVIFGGIHVTSLPEKVLSNPSVDYICIGEGEEAFAELLDSLKGLRPISGVKNIGFKRDGLPVINRLRDLENNLDVFPFPDKEIFYGACTKHDHYNIITGRGCPNACSFCGNNVLKQVYENKGKLFRRRSPGNVIEELSAAKKKFRIKSINFLDDIFTLDLEWLKDFCYKYKKEINLPYFCFAHPGHVNEQVVRLLSDSGCKWVVMGIQSANQSTREKVLFRHETNDSIAQAINLFRGTKIFLISDVIFGLPGEREDELMNTLAFCNENRSDHLGLPWLRYYPKTQVISIAQEYGTIGKEEACALSEFEEYRPFTLGGNTFRRDLDRIRTLFALSLLMPKRLVRLIIRKRWHRHFPNLRRIDVFMYVIMGYVKKVFEGKSLPFHYITPGAYLRYYCKYSFRKISYSFNKQKYGMLELRKCAE